MGLIPERCKIIPAGGTAGKIRGTVKRRDPVHHHAGTFLTQAEKLGFRNLYNITDLKIPFWWNGILSREAIVKNKRPLMLKL